MNLGKKMRAATADRPSHLSSHEIRFLQKGCDLKIVDNKLMQLDLAFKNIGYSKSHISPFGTNLMTFAK